jgi:type I restriction enzyme, S subunit
MSASKQQSGIEWIGLVPNHWKILPFKFCYTNSNAGEVIDKSHWHDGNELLYTCQRKPMKSSFSEFPFRKRTTSYDLLLTRNGTPYVHLPVENSIYSNVVQRVKLNHEINREFAAFMLGSAAKHLRGFGDIIESFNMGTWNETIFLLPPKNEQESLVKFIDNQTSHIDNNISNLEKTILLLKEKRSTLISQAVTKGLNPDVKMKDSGIDWIGEVPEHWHIMKLKYLCETTKGKAFKSSEFSDSGFKIIRASDLKNNTVKFGDVYISEEIASENINVKLHQGDILVSTVGSKPEVRNSAVGQVAKLPKELEGSFLNQNTVRLGAFESQISPEYLFNLLRNDLVRRFFDIHAHGTANQASLSLADILSFSFGMPSLIEQNEICKYISHNIQMVDDMSESINQQIVSLMEYRKALISAVVTGKIDVHESV